jgi:hypothetical protein
MLTIEEREEILATAVAGIPRVAQLIAAIPTEQRAKALDAARRSYLKTVQDLGYGEAAGEEWVSDLMRYLRSEVVTAVVEMVRRGRGGSAPRRAASA